MKKLLPIISLIFLQSCTSKYLIYDFNMTHPVQAKNLYYENERFSVSFEIGRETIQVNILNKLNDGIRINWDEVSFSINGNTERAVHKSTGINRVTEVQPPTTIPPKASLQDFLVPASNVNYSTAFGGTITFDPLFPTENSAKKAERTKQKYKGTKITIFMPFYVGGKYESYYYDIMINDVTVSKYSPAEIAERNKKRK